MSQVRLAPSLAQTTLPPASAGASVAAASLTNRARMATLVARQSGSAGCRPPETIFRSATGLGWPSGSEQLSPPPGGDEGGAGEADGALDKCEGRDKGHVPRQQRGDGLEQGAKNAW